MSKNPLVPLQAAAARLASLKGETESGLALTITGGQVLQKGETPRTIAALRKLDAVTLAPGALTRGTNAGLGAAIGMIFSPVGAAIGAAAGAAMARGKTHWRVAIMPEGGEPLIIQITESKARILELAARRPIT